MIGRIKDGGLSMPDFDIIDESLKAGWVKRLLDSQAQSWKTIPFSLLDSVGDPLLFKCIIRYELCPNSLSCRFFTEVFSVLGRAYPTTLEGQRTISKVRSCGIIMKSLSAANLFFISNGMMLEKRPCQTSYTRKESSWRLQHSRKSTKLTQTFCVILACVTQYQCIGGKSLDVITKMTW